MEFFLLPFSLPMIQLRSQCLFVDPDVHLSFDMVRDGGIVIGHGVNATLVGAPTWCPDSPSGGAIYLNGIDQYVDLGHSMDCWAKPEYCACGHTLALWVKFGPDDVAPNTHRLVLSSGGRNNHKYHGLVFNYDDDKIVYKVKTLSTNYYYNAPRPLNGVWFHIALTLDKETGIQVFMDGVENPGGANHVTPKMVAVEDPDMDGVMVGTQAPTPGHFGEMYLADLKFYHRKLNAYQAYRLYLQGTRWGS